MADRQILKQLINKYGKNTILNYVNEAFQSSVMRKFDDGIRSQNAEVRKTAYKARADKMDRLYRKHFDKSAADEPFNSYELGFYGKPGDMDRESYEKNAQYIQRDFEYYMRDHSVEALNKVLERYGMYDIDWYSITDEDFIEVPKNKIRKYAKDAEFDNYIVFWIDDEDKIFAVSRGTRVAYIRKSLRTRGRFNAEATKIKDLIESSITEKALVLTNVEKFRKNRIQKHIDRDNSRKGSVERTEAYNNMVRRENIARYERIIAQNNINKFDKVDTDVRAAVRSLADYCLGDDCDFDVVQKANKLIDTILTYYANFCKNRKDVKSSDENSDKTAGYYSFGTARYYNDKMKGYVDLIYDEIKNLNELL